MTEAPRERVAGGWLRWVSPDGRRLLLARVLRTFAYGYLSVVLGIYLDRLGLSLLSTRDVECRTEIGEGVSRSELTVRLIEVEADDRQERERGDRGEEDDVRRPIGSVAGDPGEEIA